MKKSLIRRLLREGKIKLIELSSEISLSYLEKSKDCLKSARLLNENKLIENSISMSYYAMYNSVLSLLFRVGIKSENTLFSIYLLDKLFRRKNLFEILSFAKKERIDKQYYINLKEEFDLESSKDLFFKAEEFLIEIKLLLNKLNLSEISVLREEFKKLIE